MPKQVILDTEFFSLWYDSDISAVQHEIKKPIPTAQMKEMLTKGCETLASKKAKKWLSDDRKNGMVPQEAEEWITSSWIPQTVKAGWKSWALVLPASAIAKLSLGRLQKAMAEVGVQVQTFTEPEEARKWLAQQ